MDTTTLSKADLVDNYGKPLTQSLFLELGYSDFAVFTLKDYDYEYKGKTYLSIKKLYLQEADPTEYQFATKHLLGWRHWQRILENKAIRRHIDEWREELEIKMRCEGVASIIQTAKTGSFQAAKWLSDRGWDQRGAGRPSKAEVDREKKFQARVDEEYGADVHRLFAGSK